MDARIKRTLEQILEYIGADLKYAEIAQLHAYIEWLIKEKNND